MAPMVRSLPSYVKDSQHALQIFRDFNFLGEDKLISTMDITSLYTVIPNVHLYHTAASLSPRRTKSFVFASPASHWMRG